MARTATTASHGNRKMTMVSLGRTETTSNAKTEIINHGKTRIRSHGRTTKAKMINPMTPVLHCLKIKKFFVPADCDENVFQIICTLVKAQIDKAKQLQVATGKRLMK